MTAFKAGIDEFFPYQGKVVQVCAEQVDALPAGYFRIKAIFFCDLAQHDQLVGGDLAARHTRNY